MGRVKKVGIKDLKNNLSAYLREVRRGTRILVTDRHDIAAELHEPGATYDAPESDNPLLEEWIAKGIVTPPSAKKAPLPESPVRLEDGTALRLLDESRDEGRR